ncbi:hypothetical protein AKJ41_02340 [candidate division MSBL1 archaeon SCGC-AAA259O05]|uniref:Xylose isomerase-like TIM barrel domain-containing protein n=1 Tax=candidate division MSBL1 archaeon SCGC-AAA259O05 TaxID=1698271 RepID=A0A133V439_9EURY|nr:hypothetical protein AKJ41_02340 [candidate division MSBL1 archaeon SCGC-AAA259O05]
MKFENVTKEKLLQKLSEFKIETPSWGFERGGTRFETYETSKDRKTIEDRIEGATRVHELTGKGERVSVHFPWDGENREEVEGLRELLQDNDLKAGSVNANLFSMRPERELDDRLRFGSFISPYEEVRESAIDHVFDCVQWMRILDSKNLVLWLPDGSNSPGQMSFYDMLDRTLEYTRRVCETLEDDETLLIEYKPFEPAFYATAVPDWGTALYISQAVGENAKVLVDTGHHLQASNIEQIVAYLAKSGKLGGFHFNDRKYADDDLVAGSLRPYQLFRVFCTLQEAYRRGFLGEKDLAFALDQSTYVKDPTEAMIESIENIMKNYLKALLVDYRKLRTQREEPDPTEADRTLRKAFEEPVKDLTREWKEKNGLPMDPIGRYRR